MGKIIITEKQYNKIIESIIVENEKPLNFNEELLLVIGKILGVKLTKFNEFKVEKTLKNKETLSKVKKILLNDLNREKLIDDLKNKGMVDPEEKISNSVDKIMDSFNNYSEMNNLDVRITPQEMVKGFLNDK